MFIFAPANRKGEVLEWLKRRVWKARDLPKGFAGSNPALSAESRGCHQPRLFASTAGSPFLFFLERGIIFISCAFASMVVPSPPPSALCTGPHHSFSMSQSAQEDPRHLLSPPTRRETPSKHVLTRTGGLPTPLHSSCADPTLSLSGSSSKRARPVPGVQGAPLRPQEDRQRLCSPPTHQETPSKHVLTRAGGMSAPLHSSCADGNHSQACSDPHRRTPDIFSVLLRTVLLLRKRGEWNPAVPVSDSR